MWRVAVVCLTICSTLLHAVSNVHHFLHPNPQQGHRLLQTWQYEEASPSLPKMFACMHVDRHQPCLVHTCNSVAYHPNFLALLPIEPNQSVVLDVVVVVVVAAAVRQLVIVLLVLA